MVQVFAWGKMIASYSRIMPIHRAVELTFTPGNLCEICKVVSDAKAKEDPSSVVSFKTPESPVLLCEKPVLVVEAPIPAVSRIAEPSWAPGRERAAPPLPPPRGELA
jgi:hypothetical protein